MTRVHTAGLITVVYGRPRSVYQALGWGKRGPAGVMFASERSFGHGGSTGSFFWVDPAWNLAFVFLSARGGLDHRVPMRALNAAYGSLTA